MLGLEIGRSITKVLKVPSEDVTFWVDSMNVLCWIRSQSRCFKSFVANRIGMIHIHTMPSQWRYVPSKLNSADMITRTIKVKELIDAVTWWQGPEDLSKSKSEWPTEDSSAKSSAEEEKS